MCNWNRPSFSPITVAIETAEGEETASTTYTPNVNIGNNVANKFTGVTLQSFEFDITKSGYYVIAFYADAARNADFVVGTINIQAMSFDTTGITDVTKQQAPAPTRIYDLSGRRVANKQLKPGLYIINGRKTVVK